MSGFTKYIYDNDIREIIKMWSSELKSIQELLPRLYTKSDVISLLKKYYPHEYNSVVFKYNYYKIKDKFLLKHKKKTRFNMPFPDRLLERVDQYKLLMSNDYKNKHASLYDEKIVKQKADAIWKKRKVSIERINNKIEISKSKAQQVIPSFLDKLMGLYERKNTSQKDRIYIILELKKYYNDKIINFFFKLNDTELNFQLREIAFKHLQSFNYHPRLRKQKYIIVHTANKKRKQYLKKEYSKQRFQIPENPNELEYRIKNSKEQKIQKYDCFISHSSHDKNSVQKLIQYENKIGNNVYCDWISDVDYLKRHLLCEATLNVIEHRILQSNKVIFVRSDNSIQSVWCKYELNFSLRHNKEIFVINKKDIDINNFDFQIMQKDLFYDSNYKKLALLEGCNIVDV